MNGLDLFGLSWAYEWASDRINDPRPLSLKDVHLDACMVITLSPLVAVSPVVGCIQV